MAREVVIVSAVRTPIGSFGGSLAEVSATQLGAAAVKSAVERAGIDPKLITEAYMGAVLQANLGQAPARQAIKFAGLPNEVQCTTVNKVCASGMKSTMLATQSILLGDNDVIIAGGMESMSGTPYYVEKARYGYKFGNGALVDGIGKDGLTDVYNQKAMGVCADATAVKYGISREAQDAFAIDSYQRAAAATDAGMFRTEIVAVEIPQKKGDPLQITADEEYKKVMFDKIPGLRPAFTPDGTVTAGNASGVNDGACALLLASEGAAAKHGLTPRARVVGMATAGVAPRIMGIGPAPATRKVLQLTGLKLEQLDVIELNEAFAAQGLAVLRDLGLKDDDPRVNPNGGAIALGHPLGASGARLVTTAINQLHRSGGRYALCTMCIGVGQGIALIVERV
jgi:acetyl-CoA C-acetyltransferase